MILVTGAAGFIGGHLSRALRNAGHEVWEHDPASEGTQKPLEYLARREWEAVFHLGAISDTTCEDEAALAETNIDLTMDLSCFCEVRRIPFIYASSASVYGNGDGPLNAYARSKLACDLTMQRLDHGACWYGLRFFNVWGEGEGHKGTQASMVSQLKAARIEGRRAKLFALDARRDFVAVEDCVAVMIWLWRNLPKSGIYDVGTGVARTFRDLAGIIGVEYDEVPMPKSLEGKYQFSTKANLGPLRAAGYSAPFAPLEAAWPLQLLATKGARS